MRTGCWQNSCWWLWNQDLHSQNLLLIPQQLSASPRVSRRASDRKKSLNPLKLRCHLILVLHSLEGSPRSHHTHQRALDKDTGHTRWVTWSYVRITRLTNIVRNSNFIQSRSCDTTQRRHCMEKSKYNSFLTPNFVVGLIQRMDRKCKGSI